MVLTYIILPFIKIKGDLRGDLREIIGKIRGDLREIIVVIGH
jgi:hypothetical protein